MCIRCVFVVVSGIICWCAFCKSYISFSGSSRFLSATVCLRLVMSECSSAQIVRKISWYSRVGEWYEWSRAAEGCTVKATCTSNGGRGGESNAAGAGYSVAGTLENPEELLVASFRFLTDPFFRHAVFSLT